MRDSEYSYWMICQSCQKRSSHPGDTTVRDLVTLRCPHCAQLMVTLGSVPRLVPMADCVVPWMIEVER